jgi:hypothetical protein
VKLENVKIKVSGTCDIHISKPNEATIDLDINGFAHEGKLNKRNWIRLNKKDIEGIVTILNLYKENL